MALAITGLTCDEIAEKLTITANTVKSHLKHIYLKTGAHNRLQLSKVATTLSAIAVAFSLSITQGGLLPAA